MLWRRLACCRCGLRVRGGAASGAASHRYCSARPSGPTATPSSAEPALSGTTGAAADFSPFLLDLLHPAETVELQDATRTYRTMDVVAPCAVYDPRAARVEAEVSADAQANKRERVPHRIREAHAAGRLWTRFASASDAERAAKRPPAWFEHLCRDLFYRTGGDAASATLDAAAALSEPRLHDAVVRAEQLRDWRHMPMDSSDDGVGDGAGGAPTSEVDPYLWLSFHLYDVRSYDVAPYIFPRGSPFTPAQRHQLCLGDPAREYVCFGSAYGFPERWQIPTSIGTRPVRLLVDPLSPAPVVLLQLGADLPPATWLPVRGTAAAVRRVLGEFAQMAALHRDHHHHAYEERHETAVRVMELQQLPRDDPGDVLRFMAYEARNAAYTAAPLREFVNQQEFFLGEYDEPERLLEYIDLCPQLFSIAPLRTVTDLHAEHMTPTIAGPGVAPSLFRCIYSKALLLVTVHLSAEVKLPPQDPEAFRFLWRDAQAVPRMKVPIFARVIWPDNTRMCAGGLINRRLNKMFGTELAADIPVDAALALLFTMQWAGALPQLLGVQGMRQRVAELLAATQVPQPALLYPSTREVPNPEYTIDERLGMHLQYLSQLGDPAIVDTITSVLPSASAPVRMGCAKAALIAGDRALFRHIVRSEPPGRMQSYMTKLVRKRKARDLIDAEPRLLDEQFEFAAPLWTKRNTRIDRNTLEGAVDAARLQR